MASSSTSFSQFDEAKPSATTLLWQASQYRPRTHRTKAIAFSILSFLLLLWMISSSRQQAEPDFWAKFPSRHPFPERPEDAQVALPRKSDLSVNDTLPHDLGKTNPHLHVLVPTVKGSRGACRTMTSAMILGYPPPTLIGYGHERPGATEFERTVEQITRVRDYLKNSRVVKDRDFVLIVDAQDVFFQLPPRVLVERFQELLRKNNQKLQKKYGYAVVEKPNGAPPDLVQKYTQRVLFGASKLCYGALDSDPGCVSVPESTLPPDVYGWKTDVYPDGHLNRPRWLNPGAVIGQAADLRIIYDEVLRVMEQRRKKHGDYQALTQIFGRQEVVRELERLRTVNKIKEWVYGMLGISDAVNIDGISVRLETGHRYEYGIGVDYESQLFFNQILSRNDVEWIKFNNITKTSLLQGQFGVPREHRLLLPADIAALPNPFNQTRFAREQTTPPAYNATLDKLPNPKDHTWNNIPLMTNPHSASVPVLAHLNGDPKLRNAWWEKMWFFPWARALLRRYVRSSHGFDAAQSALLGGQEWWDMRGGRGGLWTDDENWVTLSEVCEGQERDLFDDDLGPWAKENGDPDVPVYNQFGNLIKGKEKEEEEFL
ncbi:uncharacterized protein N7496_001424 [Penicillium cataractarum]|uniref:Uncharacterized protein n=1 Tax=Penicillium cataractarum TaxID=2100454 RepID=A0A9W9VVY3_9EURO|nr:uncharacterized protein N7496_001424 [Penicillium cataractarum]KAJ5390356.1 hypothetical protein N7496_001424 [Penicillium cataractarum]